MSLPRPANGDPVPEGSCVLRLPKPPPDFAPERWLPTWQLFEPSTGDKRHAEERNRRVRVSVWDEARTTVQRARAFREGPTIVVRVGVRGVLDVGALHERTLLVVYDPLDPPDDARPGADGHAGIEGLDRPKDQPKRDWRTLLEDLAKIARLVEGPVETQPPVAR